MKTGDSWTVQDLSLIHIWVYVLVILVTLFYSRTSKGMAFVAIGENPRAADSAGIPVHRSQWAAVLLNGMLGGLGGAYLVLDVYKRQGVRRWALSVRMYGTPMTGK